VNDKKVVVVVVQQGAGVTPQVVLIKTNQLIIIRVINIKHEFGVQQDA
jgi:hypothetical protein